MSNSATIHPLPPRPQPEESKTPLQIAAPAPPAPVRKQWTYRADLKWIFGIPFTVLLGMMLVVLALFMFTSAGSAQETIAAMNAPLVSEPMLQDGKARVTAPVLFAFLDSQDFARQVYEDHSLLDQQILAIPGAVQPGADGESVGGGDENGQLTEEDNPGRGLQSLMNLYSLPLSVLSGGTHAGLGSVLTVLLILLVATGIPFIAFSRRMGRFVSAGVSLAVASWPALFVVTLFHSGLADMLAEQRSGGVAEGAGDDVGRRVIVDVISPFAENSLGQAGSVYRFFALLSLACFLTAGVGVLIRRYRQRAAA